MDEYAVGRHAVGAAAAVPVLPERLARASARDRAAATVHLQLLWARWYGSTMRASGQSRQGGRRERQA
jgi:hypothetical protein